MLLCAAWLPARVLAHPAAAESPSFLDAPCMVVADKREQEYLDFTYAVLMDDTAIEPGDIPVTDAKTHQFFALAGTIYQVGVDDFYVPFMGGEAESILFPLWVTHRDVQRSAAAVELATGVTAEQTDLPPARVLETRPDLDNSWLRITQDDARRPITSTQALSPVRWKLTDVPAGVYTVTGYVFSPPYNAWAARPGVVKIVDAEHNPAAGALAPVNEVVFAYQGRRVQGCVDVPADTRLDAFYFVEEKPELGWVPWVQDQSVQTGDLELCFHTDRKDISGSIRLRWDLRPADGGAVTSLRTKDTFTWLPGSGECKESAAHCCAFPGGETKDAGVAGSAGAATAGAGGASSMPSVPAANSGGCSTAVHPAAANGVSWFAAALALMAYRRWRRKLLLPGA